MRTRAATRFVSSALMPVALAAFTALTARAEAPPPDDEADEATQGLEEYHRHHQHGGISQFTELALDTLGVEPKKQAKVDAIHAGLHGCTEPVEEKEASALRVLADGVAAGQVDAAKVDELLAEMNTQAVNIHDCVAPKLNQLHAALSPVERDTLGDKVLAHWHVWRAVNHDAVPGSPSPGGRLAALKKEVGLEPEQIEKMSQALKGALAGLAAQLDADQVAGQVRRFATAFAGKAFDATSITTTTTATLSTHGAKRMAIFYETVAPLLTPEQRTTLAAHLREHATHHSDEGAGR